MPTLTIINSALLAICAHIEPTCVPCIAVIDTGISLFPFIASFISEFVYKVPSLKPSGGLFPIDWSQ